MLGFTNGGSFQAFTEVEGELLPGVGSGVAALMLAVLVIAVPSATSQLTRAARVILFVSPEASDAYVTVRALPLPPQTPPAAVQETRVSCEGKLSVTVTWSAAFGPLFRIVMV